VELPLDDRLDLQLVNLFQALVLGELFFEVVEGGFGVEEGCFEGYADIAALLVENPIEQPAAVVQTGIFFSAAGLEVERPEGGVVFLEGCTALRLGDIVDDVGYLAGNSCFAIFYCGWSLGLFEFATECLFDAEGLLFLFGGDEVEFGFDALAGFFGLFAADVVELDRAAVAADVGGHDMAVGVAGVVVAVDEIGLLAEAYFFHVPSGDGLHLLVGQLVAGVEVEGDVLAGRDPVVELHASLEAAELFVEAEVGGFFQEVGGGEELGAALGDLLFVVGQGAGDAVGCHYFRSHGWRDLMSDRMVVSGGRVVAGGGRRFWPDDRMVASGGRVVGPGGGRASGLRGRLAFRYGSLFPVLWR